MLLRSQVIDWDDGTTEHRRRKRHEVLAMTAVLIDTTFFQTAGALARYMKSLGKVECVVLCGMVGLTTSGSVSKMQNLLVRAVERNLGLMQLATVSGSKPCSCTTLQSDWSRDLCRQVCYCWNDISSILAAKLQTAQHPDMSILEQLRVSRGMI